MLRRFAGTSALGLLAGIALTACFSSPPQILALSPVNGSTSVGADTPIRVDFDQPVNRGSVTARFHIDPSLSGCADPAAAFSAPPTASCRVVWRSDSAGFTLFHGGAPFQPNQQYTLTLSPGVSSRDGSVNSLDHHWRLTSAPAPVVTGTSPDDGSTGVAIDTPLVVSFSTAMAPGPTAGAIHLVPPVTGTRVVGNTNNRGRVVILPGRLLDPDTAYTLQVGAAASEEHGQHLAAPVVIHFRTGGLSGGGHALVLARRPAEAASEVLLTALGPLQPGEPTAATTVLRAPRCEQDSCGAVRRDQPVLAYLEAALAPDGRALAVVAQDLTIGGAPPVLHVIPLLGGPDLDLGAAQHPAWSPSARVLAYGAPDGVHLLARAPPSDIRLPAGDPLDAAPVWSGDGSVLALPVRSPAGVAHIDLADPLLGVRYPVPGIAAGDATAPAPSPDGGELALRRDGSGVTGTWVVRLRSGGAAPRRLGDDLVPVSYTAPATLLALERSETDSLVRVSVGSGDRVRLAPPAAGAELASAVAVPSRRQVAFLGAGSDGGVQAYIENADGSNPAALTAFAAGQLEAASVSFGG
ncbi:MAG: hypothetical protein E6J14_12435 [Chloroflexi bacterium]|nr:MAG: hypothetical protein E6J14_12435 [Chloroflexota bacterium]